MVMEEVTKRGDAYVGSLEGFFSYVCVCMCV